jgi:GST-like protein
VLDRQLAEREFICADYSIADMAAWPWVLYRGLHGLRLEDYPNVERWFHAIDRRPAVRKALEGAFVPTLEQEQERVRRA